MKRLAGQQSALSYEGRHYEREHRLAEEADAFAACAEVRRRIAARDPDSPGNRIHLAEVQDMLAWSWIRLGGPTTRLRRSRSRARSSRRRSRPIRATGRHRRALAVNAYYLALAYGNRSAADDPREAQRADGRTAREHFERGAALLRELDLEDGLAESDRSMIPTLEQGAEIRAAKLVELE